MWNRTTEERFRNGLNALIFVGSLGTIPVIVLLEQGVDGFWIHAADWAIWVVFLLEFVIESAIAPDRLGYLRRSWLSPVVIVLSFPLLPNLLGTVRLVRLARFLRFARLAGVTLRGLAELRAVLQNRGLLYVALTTTFLVLVGGAAFTVVEPSPAHRSLFDGIWWAVVTASTVGYGDIAPATGGGRLIAVLLMLSGVGLISTLGASITTYFIGRQESEELRELRDRAERIERLLEEVSEKLEKRSDSFSAR